MDTGVLEDVEGLMGGRLGLFCKSQVSWVQVDFIFVTPSPSPSPSELELSPSGFDFCPTQENVIWSHMEARCSNSDIDFNLVNPYDHWKALGNENNQKHVKQTMMDAIDQGQDMTPDDL